MTINSFMGTLSLLAMLSLGLICFGYAKCLSEAKERTADRLAAKFYCLGIVSVVIVVLTVFAVIATKLGL